MDVVQATATDGDVHAVSVTETTKGSTGLSGSFTLDLNDPNGARTVQFDEPDARLKRKLSELTTIGEVHIERYNYPTTTTGGWSGNAVTAGTLGGYEWYVWFVKNPGTKDGYSFPPGTGNIDPLTVDYTNIAGTTATVSTVLYTDGSTPIDGTYTVTLDGVTSDPIEYDQSAIETKYLIESMSNVGTVTATTQSRYMEEIPGVYATVDRDSNIAYITYANNDTERPTDIRQYLSPW